MTTELTDGLVWWTSKHPEWPGEDAGWGPEVSSYALTSGQSVVVLDPVAPPAELHPAGGRAVTVVLTCAWHARDAAALAKDGATTFAPDAVESVPGARVYSAGDVLPGDIHAVPAGNAGEYALWIPSHGALAVGDSLTAADGTVQLPAAGWLPEGVTIEQFKAALQPLLDLDPSWLLTTHGPPVPDAARALKSALT